MAHVIALELESGAEAIAHTAKDGLDIAEGILKDKVVRTGQIGLFPVVLPLPWLGSHGEQAEIDGAHIKRAHLRLGLKRGQQAILHGHVHAAAGGDVQYGVRRLLDTGQELHEHLGVRSRPAIDWIAGMEMYDRGSRLRRRDTFGGDLVRGDRQGDRHGRRMDGPRHRAADDDFVSRLGHSPLRLHLVTYQMMRIIIN